jgi:G3E family GTPase
VSVGAAGAKTPVTILTGYLGSGKTTLLNRVMQERHGRRIAVIENEFGEIGIDAELVIGIEENIVQLRNGCLCCTVRDDLRGALTDLARRGAAIDHVIIETTGLADIGPVLQTFRADPSIRAGFEVAGVLTVVDAKHVELHFDESCELREQVAFGDVILLNKVDLVTPATADRRAALVRRVNPLAKIIRSSRAEVPVEEMLALDRGSWDARQALDRELFDDAEEHHHDASVGSVSVELPGLLDPLLVYRWLGDLLMFKATDLFRIKGVLAIAGVDHRVVLQGVHMSVEFIDGARWEEQEAVSRVVFIGRGLSGVDLTRSLRRCLREPSLAAAG